MNNLNIAAISTAIAFAFSTGVMAQNMSKEHYISAKNAVAAEYKSAKAACESLSGNANDIAGYKYLCPSKSSSRT
jgi:hypothetical protein